MHAPTHSIYLPAAPLRSYVFTYFYTYLHTYTEPGMMNIFTALALTSAGPSKDTVKVLDTEKETEEENNVNTTT